MEPLEIREIDPLIVWHALRGAVGETRAQPRFAQGLEVGIGVAWTTDVMTPIMDVSDAVIDSLGAGEPRALIHIVREEFLTEHCCRSEIAKFRLVPRHAPEQRVPHVPM